LCDVFWNNELFGTMELQRQGVLSPYRGPEFARIPRRFKDPKGYWAGFGGRFRVWIVNSALAGADRKKLEALLESRPERVAMARPLYGTTLTQYAVRWAQWGGERLQHRHGELRRRGLAEVPGNATVKQVVAAGVCTAGFTDTDDAFAALDAGRAIAMTPVLDASGKTICIPNTVAIIRGTNRLREARELVDFLLSAEGELALANSPSRQVPLGDVPPDSLPAEVRRMSPWVQQSVDLPPLFASWRACRKWLKTEEY
jgi:iron(III) transport system substrate-binding protein